MVPPSAMPRTKAACLAAVMHGARTVTEVVKATGYSRDWVWSHLRELHDEGLVVYPPGMAGALRPRLRIVAAG